MSYKPLSFDDFPGLDLSVDPQDGGSPYLSDVEFDVRGRVRQRPGCARFDATATSGASQVALFPAKLGSAMLLALSTGGGNLYLDKYTTAGVLTAVGNWSAVFLGSIVHFGTPTASYVYISSMASGHASTAAIRRYDGTSLTTATGEPMWLGVTPQSNRLVQAGFIANADRPTGIVTDVSTSTVVFSDAGAPETYSPNNYVHLRPGDGEAIRAVVTWRDLLFVFKETSVFVFYSESTNPTTGDVVFNYRRIDLPTAIADPGNTDVRVASAGARGVYFAASDGIYRTTGGVPQLISEPISPIFRAESDLASTDTPYPYLSAVRDRLFFRYTDLATGVTKCLVFDERTQRWTAWQLGFDSAQGQYPVQWPGSGTPNALFWQYGDHIYKQSKDYLTDAGTRIAGTYDSPVFEVAQERAGEIRESLLWGTGTVGLSVAADHGSFDTAQNIELGSAPTTTGKGRLRYARKGFRFAHRLQAPAAVTDAFATDTIANYTLDTGSGTIAVSGGQLVPSTTAEKRLVYTAMTFTDGQVTTKYTTGTVAAGNRAGVIVKRVSATDYITVEHRGDGTLNICKNGNVITNVAAAMAGTTSYWVRGRIENNVVTAELWTSAPTATSVPASTVSSTLSGGDATTYGQGVEGSPGLVLVPNTTSWRMDDFAAFGISRWAVNRITHHVREVRSSGVSV